MTRRSDEFRDMNDMPLARPTTLGREGADADVAQFLAELHALGQCAAPTPSAELTALLGGARPPRRRALRVVARTAVAVAAAVLASVVAAANHDLPSPAQRVVSNVVNVLTPFHIEPPGPAPAPTQHPQPNRDDRGTSPEPKEPGESGNEPDDHSPQSAEPSGSDEQSGRDGSGDGGGGESDSTGTPAGTGDGGGAGNDG